MKEKGERAAIKSENIMLWEHDKNYIVANTKKKALQRENADGIQGYRHHFFTHRLDGIFDRKDMPRILLLLDNGIRISLCVFFLPHGGSLLLHLFAATTKRGEEVCARRK